MAPGRCRFCSAELQTTFVDLGMQPLANSYLDARDLARPEPLYPLHLYVCDRCFLVQVSEAISPETIFGDYAYFSSYSDSWLRHMKAFTEMVVARFGLNGQTQVIEIGSNDGYLLQYFVEKGIPVLGVEPARNVSAAAVTKGIPTITEFFGRVTAGRLAADGRQADLLVGNNVLAHVPDLNDFVAGLKIVLKPHGVMTLEFPHLMRLMQENQFDTVYHEHFSYFSFTSAQRVFAEHGLRLFDVEELPTHGGSLRIYGCDANADRAVTGRVSELLATEEAVGLTTLDRYRKFSRRAQEAKGKVLDFMIQAKERGLSVAGYGAPAKGNTLLNYCGIRADLLEYTVDRSPHKQGHFLPGSHIPIYHPDKIKQTRPDYLFILPWNIKDEIMEQMRHIREWGGRFVTPIPEVRIYP